MTNSSIDVALISGFITLIVALVGIFGNLFLANKNRKLEISMKEKEIESKEYQFLLENLKGFWEHQNSLYSETLKVASTLVLDEDIKSEKFLGAYRRFWELYWSELPTCESDEIKVAMIGIKDMIYRKKNLNPDDKAAIRKIKEEMNDPLYKLSRAIRASSILLEYSERIKKKFQLAG